MTLSKKAKAEAERVKTQDASTAKARDSFKNVAAAFGWGANGLFSSSTYGFHPVSRERILLEWMYRGSWVVGAAVDSVADDMTRAGIEFQTVLPPQDEEALLVAQQATQMWPVFNEAAKWGRLYGGAVAVALIDGQDVSTPLNPATVREGQFKGFTALDRWMIEPSLSDLVTEFGPDFGLPKFYRVTVDPTSTTGGSVPSPLVGKRIHHTRVARFEGVPLPWQQRQSENFWSMSVVERLFDRLIAFDSATTGMAQLVYKSYLRVYSVPKLREIIAEGGPAFAALQSQIKMIRDWQTNEGITAIDAEDKMEFQSYTFAGLDSVLQQLGQQLSGALAIPMTRLFGQSPGGMNATGESDLRTYYDGILQKQESRLRTPLCKFLPALAMSSGVKLPAGFNFTFRTLWQLTEVQRAEVAGKITDSVGAAFDKAIIGRQTALKELRGASRRTGVFTNITDEEINSADRDPPNPMEDELNRMTGEGGPEPGSPEPPKPNLKAPK